MKLLVTIILAATYFQNFSQVLSQDVQRLVEKIELVNVLHYEFVGAAPRKTDQYKNFESLKDIATIDELMRLVQHENVVVKGYASWALIDKKYPKLTFHLEDFLQNGESVFSLKGCETKNRELVSVFYSRVLYNLGFSDLTLDDSLYYSDQLLQLNSLVLNKSETGNLLDWVLMFNDARKENYKVIKKLAFEHENEEAIRALAVYKRIEDINEFINLKEKGFVAIIEFPHTDFWVSLLNYRDNPISANYLNAISAYKSIDSRNLLLDLYSKSSENDAYIFGECLSTNYCDYYEHLWLRLWQDHGILDLKSFKNLVSSNPQRSSLAFALRLSTKKKITFVEFGFDFGSEDSILSLMLDNIFDFNPNFINSICDNFIENSKSTELQSVLDFIEINELSDLSNNMLVRLSKENSAFEYYHIAKTLLSFEDQDIKHLVREYLIASRKEWDSGNWSNSFKIMLEENGIKI